MNLSFRKKVVLRKKTDFVIVTIVLNIGSKFIFPGIFVLQYNFICVLVMLLSSLSDKIEMWMKDHRFFLKLIKAEQERNSSASLI